MEIFVDEDKNTPSPDEGKKLPPPKRKGLSVRRPEPEPEPSVNESSEKVNTTEDDIAEFGEAFAKPLPRGKWEPFNVPESPVRDSGENMLLLKDQLGEPELDESVSHREHVDTSHILTPRDKSKVESLMNDIREKLVEISEIIEPEKHPHLRASLKKKKRKKRSKNKGKKKK